MPASLDKLPEELYKLILDHVEDADKSWRERGPEPDDDGADPDTTSVKARWSTWYGQGVFSLAHVDKRWNALARSILFKRIRWSAFASSFFQLYILGEPLGRYVKELDLCYEGGALPPGVAWACALQKLPELAAISINHDAHDVYLDHVDPRRLRTLNIWFQDTVRLYDMPALLRHLVALRELELDFVNVDDNDYELEDDPARALLPSIKTLELHDVAVEDSLRFAAAFTPNITALTVTFLDQYLFRDPELHVKLVPDAAARVSVTFLEPTRPPTSLRELVLDIPLSALVTRAELRRLEALCDRLGIAYRAHTRYAARWPLLRQPGPARRPAPARVRETRDTLAWATARMQWLVDTVDAQGLDEMVASTHGLRDRRAIERS
ncbi:uncharacterized protein RHOBADRAFT_56390 [Rhodotorula graminis WP1]|uniref:F-box domain-containing protein n=1 Tax=Rhodotorula graminis (strain WP1) TaxID=578459 RepID=A0A0P9GWF8_RHOGW|nr:uncharacterized protein RHOBADRAFT_56390 [Rhodotorula graminis WP1]KPV71770.1 hypothetical protein RHOBADRAFT_56390 [Rhodotorula graminis WP1]